MKTPTPCHPPMQASLHHVSTRSARLASGQTAVSRLDFADSFVEFTAAVPKAGLYQIDIRYANGTTQTSTHPVSVNGKVLAEARYQPVGWENFQTAQVFVPLDAGVRLREKAGFAGHAGYRSVWNTLSLSYIQVFLACQALHEGVLLDSG